MDRGAWWAKVHRVAKGWDTTEATSHSHTHWSVLQGSSQSPLGSKSPGLDTTISWSPAIYLTALHSAPGWGPPTPTPLFTYIPSGAHQVPLPLLEKGMQTGKLSDFLHEYFSNTSLVNFSKIKHKILILRPSFSNYWQNT